MVWQQFWLKKLNEFKFESEYNFGSKSEEKRKKRRREAQQSCHTAAHR
jgi:hypothetical protein